MVMMPEILSGSPKSDRHNISEPYKVRHINLLPSRIMGTVKDKP